VQITPELIEAALSKLRRGAPYGIAAVLVGEATPPGLDGARWLVAVTNGMRIGIVRVEWSRSNGGERRMNVDRAFLEGEVEWRSGNFPLESRLTNLLESKTIVIRRDRLPAAA